MPQEEEEEDCDGRLSPDPQQPPSPPHKQTHSLTVSLIALSNSTRIHPLHPLPSLIAMQACYTAAGPTFVPTASCYTNAGKRGPPLFGRGRHRFAYSRTHTHTHTHTHKHTQTHAHVCTHTCTRSPPLTHSLHLPPASPSLSLAPPQREAPAGLPLTCTCM
jgi:hypothetical protein